MFGKIFESMFSGSMVGSSPMTFAVWAYVIAHTRPPGMVELNPKLIGLIMDSPPEDVEMIISALMQPDPKSRSSEHEGRRLIHAGGMMYGVPTWPKYRWMRDQEERKRQVRKAVANHRARKHPDKLPPKDYNDYSDYSNRCKPRKAQAEAEAEGDGCTPSPTSDSVQRTPHDVESPPETVGAVAPKARRKRARRLAIADASDPAILAVAEAWNRLSDQRGYHAVRLPLSAAVAGAIAVALARPTFAASWAEAIQALEACASPFLSGGGPRKWRAGLTWFLRPGRSGESETIADILAGRWAGAPEKSYEALMAGWTGR